MGRHRSDDSDDEYSRKSRKKKKRRSRSSSSSSQLSHISDSRSKKSRKKHRRSSRSRSRSIERKYVSKSSRRSRSTSSDRYSSRKKRSHSRSPGRKSSRRSSASRRGRSRSKSLSSRKQRSYSRSRRSVSPSRDRRRKSYSRERSHSADRASLTRQPLTDPAPGFIDLTLAEQAEERLKQAMKAATSADDKLKARSAVESLGSSLYQDTKNFAASVSAIESDNFVASSFKSSRSTKIKEEVPDSGMSHDDAIFGSLAISGFTLMPDPDSKPIQLDPDSIMHPSLYCDPQAKMERWISHLTQLRRRKLEGDVI